MGEEDSSIEAAAAARRERLRALKAAQELLNTPDDDNDSSAKDADGDHRLDSKDEQTRNEEDNNKEEEEEEEEGEEEVDNNNEDNVNMKFRNYLPHDKQLQEGKLAPPVLPKFEDLALAAPPTEEKKEDPFLNIAPKKPNWDLRRDVQKRLDKLERRTQKAMQILMEREEAKRSAIEEGTNGEETRENGRD